MQVRVGSPEPKQRWHCGPLLPVASRAAKMVFDRSELLRDGQDASRTGQTFDLHPEGDEGAKENETDGTRKNPTRNRVTRRKGIRAPEEAGEKSEGAAVRRDKTVSRLADCAKPRNRLVNPKQRARAHAVRRKGSQSRLCANNERVVALFQNDAFRG